MASSQSMEQALHRQAVIDACSSGDVQALKSVFDQYDVRRKGPNEIVVDSEPAPFSVHSILVAAIANKQPAMVDFLLSTFPNIQLDRQSILRPAAENPHLETFKVLYSRDPSILDHTFDYMNNFLTVAIMHGDSVLPIFMVEQGAHINEHGVWGNTSLGHALVAGQPTDLIKKLVDHGAYLNAGVVLEAIRRERLDALEYIFNVPGLDIYYCRLQPPSSELEIARETENERVIAVVTEFMERWEKEGVYSNGRRIEHSSFTALIMRQERHEVKAPYITSHCEKEAMEDSDSDESYTKNDIDTRSNGPRCRIM